VAQGKRVGFVDLNVDNFHANTYLKHIRGALVKRGYTVEGCFGLMDEPSRAWALKNNVPYFSDPAALNKVSDCFMVMAPSNPEAHLELCQAVFPFGKPTYVDKTFAPDSKTARKIFALADKHGTVVQTTSALRYSEVQEYVQQAGGASSVQHMVTWGSAGSFDEYAIHPTEMAVSCLGFEAESLMRRGTEKYSQLLINFSRRRTAVVNVHVMGETPYSAAVTTDKVTRYIAVDGANLFVKAASAILDFFDQKRPTIPREESLLIRRILDVAKQPQALKRFVRL